MATESLNTWLKMSPLYRADRFMHVSCTSSGGFSAQIEDPSGFNVWRSDNFSFDHLPREIRILIISFLPPEAIFRVAIVNKSCYDVTNDPILVRLLCAFWLVLSNRHNPALAIKQ